MCYMEDREVLLSDVRRDARRADLLQRQSRSLLVEAVRRASVAGLSQREIGLAVRRSQPEISRLLRQKQSSRLARRLLEHREEALEILSRYGITATSVFGSVATGEEKETSDIDLLVDSPHAIGLGTLSRLERELSELLGVDVDVVPERGLPDYMRERVLAEAVPL